MKRFRVWLNVSQEVYADDEAEALDIFWDDFNRLQAEEEHAVVEELEA
ncbi:MAG: hypothetical protein ACHP7P_06660 [Terriglobales bacterium]